MLRWEKEDISLCLRFVARKCLRRSEPNQNDRPFVGGFRVVQDILSDDLYKLLPLNRPLRRAESTRFEMKTVNERHSFEDPINVA